MTRPCVSVVIPTFNRAATLPRAIDSVVAQTTADWEIVVVDDGSTDGTEAVLAQYQSKLGAKLVWIRQGNRGCSVARNRGIEIARGRFIAFLDSDDEFLPHKLDRQLKLFSSRPELCFVYSDYSFVDLDNRLTPSALTAKFPLARTVSRQQCEDNLWVLGPDLFDALLRGYFIATIVGMVRREALGAIRFHERLSYAEEWLFYLQLASAGRAGFVDEPLARHHFTPDSLTRTDKARNLEGRCRLFQTMQKTFPHLSPAQESVLLGHLRDSCRDLANLRRSMGRWAHAAALSVRAAWYERKQQLIARKAGAATRAIPETPVEAGPTNQAAFLPAR